MKIFISLFTFLFVTSIACAEDTPAPQPKITPVSFSVTGLKDEATATQAKETLSKLPGISELTTDSETGTVTVQYDPAKIKPATLQKNLSDSGLKVTGQQTKLQIKGLMCQNCSNHLISVLGETDGLINVDQISHLTGQATLTFDPQKTDKEKLIAAIHTTSYRVQADKE